MKYRILPILLIALFSVAVAAQVTIQPEKKELIRASENFDLKLDTGEEVLSLPAQYFEPNSRSPYVLGRSRPGAKPMEFTASLNLPHGARITRCVMIYQDNERSKDVEVRLIRTPTFEADPEKSKDDQELLSLKSTGETRRWRIEERRPASPILINNLTGSYYIKVIMGYGPRLNNVKVFYK